MAKILFGFGGVRFYNYEDTATFSGGSGQISYIPIQRIEENVNHNIISRLYGYHVKLEISELINIDSDDYVQYQNLALILSRLVDSNNQRTVEITPRDDSTIDNDLTYECILTSPFTPTDLHRIKTGQRVKMTFMCVDKLTSIPTTVSDTTANDYWDGTDTYIDGTDTYIDEQG